MCRSVGLGISVALVASATLAAEPDRRVVESAKAQNRQAVRKLVESHADVNTPLPDGSTALHWAAFKDDLETSELLVRAGANVKAANRYGVTPLSLACVNGNGEMVEQLLKAGADPNTALPGGE